MAPCKPLDECRLGSAMGLGAVLIWGGHCSRQQGEAGPKHHRLLGSPYEFHIGLAAVQSQPRALCLAGALRTCLGSLWASEDA